ncbi:hypothetical protein RhiirA4_400257, partial [Rhizophagus irregularis]
MGICYQKFCSESRRFRNECLKNSQITERLKRVYTDEKTGQLHKLDDSNIKTHVYLHAEMNILV